MEGRNLTTYESLTDGGEDGVSTLQPGRRDKSTYSISITSISEVEIRKRVPDVPILGRIYAIRQQSVPVIKINRSSPVNGGETLLSVDTRAFFSSIFLGPDAYHVGSHLSDRRRETGFAGSHSQKMIGGI